VPYFGVVEYGQLDKARLELERWMRAVTGLEGLVLELKETAEDLAVKLRPISDRDKFAAMVTKNPVLDQLRQRLGMDFA
jgi:hypothetical protein